MNVLDTQSMKRAEDAAVAHGVSRLMMMENAGKAVAQIVGDLFDPSLRPAVLVVAGTGNNGGDGAAAARHLYGKALVSVLLLGGMSKVRAEEAAQQWRVLATMKDIPMFEASTHDEVIARKGLFDRSNVIIDAIFGTGVREGIRDPQASAIELINSAKALCIAVDIPSGLDPDSGEDHGLVVDADMTVTLHAVKPGLLKRPDVAGSIIVAGIGIP